MSSIETISEIERRHTKELIALKSKQGKELRELYQTRFELGLDGISKGDILYDHYQCIKVEVCGIGYYDGFRLNKATKKPFKNNEAGRVYIQNIKRVVKQ